MAQGRVVMVNAKAGVAKIMFYDYGTTALCKMSSLRTLQPEFCSVPELCVGVGLGGVVSTGHGWDRQAVRGLQDILRRGKMRAWMQKREGEEKLDMFVVLPSVKGLGMMIAVSKALVEGGIALASGGPQQVVDRSRMWERKWALSSPVMSDMMAMQRLVLAQMVTAI